MCIRDRFILSLIPLTCTSTPDNNSTDLTDQDNYDNISDTSTKKLKLATWNIRYLTNNSRDDAELSQIAEIINRYDIIAVQEARDTAVLDRLKNML